MKNKFSFYLDVIAKAFFAVCILFIGYRIETLIEHNKNIIECNFKFNKMQIEKLDEIIKGKLWKIF